jgi:hypothetical protein
MRLLPLILTVIMGWILFRIIRVFVRVGGANRREDGARGADPGASSGPSASSPRRTILDAEFEDITPPKPAKEEPEKPRA